MWEHALIFPMTFLTLIRSNVVSEHASGSVDMYYKVPEIPLAVVARARVI